MRLLTSLTVEKFEFHKSKTTDGRHFDNRKIAISLQPCDRFLWNLAQWHILAPYRGSFVKLRFFFENPTWRRRHVENHKNRDISATVWPIFTKSGTLMQNGSLNLSDVTELNFKNPRWRTAVILKTAWQLARFQLTQRIARSLGDSWASC